ncbi:MAG: hypothetical protein IPK33_11420 [Gemmatimonadetes bacterium]|nr:hypothetical protein [Gemmatimonadota bacterium]
MNASVIAESGPKPTASACATLAESTWRAKAGVMRSPMGQGVVAASGSWG